MFSRTFSIFGLLLFVSSSWAQHSSESAEDVSCVTCLHMSYELRNMPTLYHMILDSVLSSLDLANPECESNTVEPDACPAPSFPQWMVNKCSTTVVSLEAVGITGVLPGAEMTLTVTIRGCITQRTGETNGCTNIEDMDASTQQSITQQLKILGNIWNSVSYSGHVCVSAP